MRPTRKPQPCSRHPALCLSPGWILDWGCSSFSTPVPASISWWSGLNPGPGSSPHLVQGSASWLNPQAQWTITESLDCVDCPSAPRCSPSWNSSALTAPCCFFSFRQVEQQCRPPRSPSRRPPWMMVVGMVSSTLGVDGHKAYIYLYIYISKRQEVYIEQDCYWDKLLNLLSSL